MTKTHAVSHVDLGGGLGIPYHEGDDPQSYHPERYAEIVRRHFGSLNCKLVLEPGRLIVGNAGVLITRVSYLKHGEAKTFVIVDAGMNDLVRPTLYDAHHDLMPVREPADRKETAADFVGPACERGDYLALDRKMPGDAAGRASRGADGRRLWRGAGGNARPLIPEVLVDGNRFATILPRPSVAELIAMDHVPDWV